ncbi:TPA: endonuclease/exonuclease/phosphatase family protein, partial [Proteus mirabilis]
WNIGISPPTKSKQNVKTEKVGLAKKYLEELIIKKTLDIIALSEVSENEGYAFKQLATQLKMGYIDLSGKIGRIIIDISLIYQMNKLEFISSKFLTKLQPDNRMVRVGVAVVFKEIEHQKIITLFLSHWPSILSANDTTREVAAAGLRSSINKLFENNGDDVQFICMGDYNTEPYSNAMLNILYATRDYHLIKKKTVI